MGSLLLSDADDAGYDRAVHKKLDKSGTFRDTLVMKDMLDGRVLFKTV